MKSFRHFLTFCGLTFCGTSVTSLFVWILSFQKFLPYTLSALVLLILASLIVAIASFGKNVNLQQVLTDFVIPGILAMAFLGAILWGLGNLVTTAFGFTASVAVTLALGFQGLMLSVIGLVFVFTFFQVISELISVRKEKKRILWKKTKAFLCFLVYFMICAMTSYFFSIRMFL